MFKRVKILALPILLAVILASLFFYGCGGKAGPGETELTTQELQQIVADSLAAWKNSTSYEFSMEMGMNAEVTGGSQPGKVEMEMRASGEEDLADNEMKMDMDISMNIDAPGTEEGSQSLSAEIYMLEDWIYMKTDVMGTGAEWIKTPVTEDIREAFDLNMVDQQLAPLESLGEIRFVKYETADGSQCYVLDVVPDLEAMKDWLSEQGMMSMTTGWDPDWGLIEDMFKGLSYTMWVAKDSKLITKMKMIMDLEITAAQASDWGSDFDKMNLDLNIEMEIKHYNEPVSIELPDEAQDAIEM